MMRLEDIRPILVRWTITASHKHRSRSCKHNADADKKVIFKSCTLFTDSISETNNTQINNVKGLDAFMLMYNLIEYRGNYSKTSRILWQYCRD